MSERFNVRERSVVSALRRAVREDGKLVRPNLRARHLETPIKILRESVMKKLSLLVAVIATTVGLAAWLQPAQAGQHAEDAAVRQAIEHYFRGHATGDGQHFQKVFHPEAKLFWMRDGKFTQRTSADYIAGASGKPAPDEAQRKRSIESIDITGNAAVVKVLLDYPNARLTDYMSMLKIDGEWKIVNKTFVSEPKTR
jgi:hypothetical protein